MASAAPPDKPASGFKQWLLEGHVKEGQGPYEAEKQHDSHPWWKVMCLTGVDYFSTLGYQPGIAALAAGLLSPIATLILVLLTLFGALPIYNRVAAESPHGEGSIAMLERLFSWWTGKLFVLVLLGFVATDFIITITLSAADATAHLVENPFTPLLMRHHDIGVTLVLVTLLGAVFLKGFKEAMGIAVVLVATYLALNAVVIGVGFYHFLDHPGVVAHWREALFTQHGNPWVMIGIALLLFPKLALGLSGFETGVAVMPLVNGEPGDTPENPVGRIRNTRKLLLGAALIMSVFLLTSSFVTTLLIPVEQFRAATAGHEAGKANGRALAYLAHQFLGDGFGTVYDISTILILWFAGASAMAGLLNIVPRYLPRYGMAPDWTKAVRPLVLIFTLIAFAVTILFKADVDAQGGAYATGVLVLMSSAAVAVTRSAWTKGQKSLAFMFGFITLVFLYTAGRNIHERPEGIKIAAVFIIAIVLTSFISRVARTTELRVDKIEIDDTALEYIREAARMDEIRIIANKLQGHAHEHALKEQEQRRAAHIPPGAHILFLEVEVTDPSAFAGVLKVRGVEIDGFKVLQVEAAVVPNAIAYVLLYIRDITGKVPHAYFSWSDTKPLPNMFRYVLLGEGDTAPVTHEVLRQAERDPDLRPAIHIGGER
jgi:hypothetical protein